MIPFIDIMLVLLTIVLMTSSFIATGKLPVNLPVATGNAQDENRELEIIELSAEGMVYYGSVPVTMDELRAGLVPLDKNASFLIRADRDVRLQVFVDVADLLKQLEFTRVAVQIKTRGYDG
jgi:biopolymer transport protein ExbD